MHSVSKSGRTLIIGDSEYIPAANDDLDSVTDLSQPKISIAVIHANHVTKLKVLQPKHIIVILGWNDIFDGCSESLYHADIVAMFDELQKITPGAAVSIVAIPRYPTITPKNVDHHAMRAKRKLFNATARLTAKMRNFEWVDSYIIRSK